MDATRLRSERLGAENMVVVCCCVEVAIAYEVVDSGAAWSVECISEASYESAEAQHDLPNIVERDAGAALRKRGNRNALFVIGNLHSINELHELSLKRVADVVVLVGRGGAALGVCRCARRAATAAAARAAQNGEVRVDGVQLVEHDFVEVGYQANVTARNGALVLEGLDAAQDANVRVDTVRRQAESDMHSPNTCTDKLRHRSQHSLNCRILAQVVCVGIDPPSNLNGARAVADAVGDVGGEGRDVAYDANKGDLCV